MLILQEPRCLVAWRVGGLRRVDYTTGRRNREYNRDVIRAFSMLCVVMLGRAALADDKVGVVVSGADAIRVQTETAVRTWLTHHTLSVAPSPLAKDSLNRLLDCLLLSDMGCARNIVEGKATASSVVGILEQISGKRERRLVQLSAFWIAKHHDVVSLQRTCDGCTDDVLAKTLDSMMADLARMAPTMTGRIRVTTDQPGITALVDGQSIGVTPVEHQVAFGSHTISLSRDGKIVGERQVEVGPNATVEVAVPVRATPPPTIVKVIERPRSRLMPGIVLGVGGAAIVTGAILYAVGSPSGKSYYYRDTRPWGLGVAAGGAAIGLVGAYLMWRRGTESVPQVAVTPGGALVGWAGSF